MMAAHNNRLTIESFRIIFPMLKSGDLYFVEDAHTSYYETQEYEGSEKPCAGKVPRWNFLDAVMPSAKLGGIATGIPK